MDGNYEFFFDFGAKFVSITSTNPDFKFFLRKTGINKISELISLVKNNMSSLCEAREMAPQSTPTISKAEQLAAKVIEKKTETKAEEKPEEAPVDEPEKEEVVEAEKSDITPPSIVVSEIADEAVDVKEETNTVESSTETFQALLDSVDDKESDEEDMETAQAAE